MQNDDGQPEKHCVLLQLVGNLESYLCQSAIGLIKALTGN